MDVFSDAATSGFLRDAAISAAHELGVFDALREPRTIDELAPALAIGSRRRLRRLLDVLVGLGVVDRGGAVMRAARVPSRPQLARDGWGSLADVIRHDRRLVVDRQLTARMHRHLVTAGADAARELAPWLGEDSLLDIGGGAGAYTAAFLAARPGARATLVDHAEVVALAKVELAGFGERVRFIASDARAAQLGEHYGAALLANVLHLHGEASCAKLCAVAARAVAPGGLVVIKDLRVDPGRAGPLDGLLFALNMAIYTDDGDVHDTAQLRAWLVRAGLVDIEERRLAVAPDAIVVIGRRPVEDAIARGLDSALARTGKLAWRELEDAGSVRAGVRPLRLGYPAPLRRMLSRALAVDADPALRRHYSELMPRARIEQIASTAEPAATLLHAALDWSRLPRMTAALDRLYAELAAAGVDGERALGAASANELRARTSTFAALYNRTHYGGCMPVLYGYPADLEYFAARGAERRLDVLAIVDRYLTVPMVHELCHFGRDREALPIHLDECVAGWLGVYVWPEFAYPTPDQDDAIYAAPWLAQIGQAIARGFGIAPVVRGHTGVATWRAVLPASFLAAGERLAWKDWLTRRPMHFLSDTLQPRPWVALALAVAAGHPVAGHTLDSLAALPLAALPVPGDDAFDRAVVADALRAMCLDNIQVAGTFRAYARVPTAPIDISAAACSVTTPRRGAVDRVDPWYWLPPGVAARLLARGASGYRLALADLCAIPEATAAIVAGCRGCERDGFALVLR